MRTKRLKRLYDVYVGVGGNAIHLGESDLESDSIRGILTSPVKNEIITFPMPIMLNVKTISDDGYLEISERRLKSMNAWKADCFLLIPNPLDNEVRRSGKSPYLIVFATCAKYEQ